MISREEIYAILGIWEYNPTLVLYELKARLNDQNHNELYPQIRFLLVCVKLFCQYKSLETRYSIMKLNIKLLNVIYSNNKNPDFKVFSFFLLNIFHFRNCVSIGDFESATKDLRFIKQIRDKMIEVGIGVQTELALSC